jgi:hypothetical protein
MLWRMSGRCWSLANTAFFGLQHGNQGAKRGNGAPRALPGILSQLAPGFVHPSEAPT